MELGLCLSLDVVESRRSGSATAAVVLGGATLGLLVLLIPSSAGSVFDCLLRSFDHCSSAETLKRGAHQSSRCFSIPVSRNLETSLSGFATLPSLPRVAVECPFCETTRNVLLMRGSTNLGIVLDKDMLPTKELLKEVAILGKKLEHFVLSGNSCVCSKRQMWVKLNYLQF